jgi:hypothetical protein
MAELKPGTTMARIAELERITAELARVTRELLGRLDLAEQLISQLEAAGRLAGGMWPRWRPMSGDEPW